MLSVGGFMREGGGGEPKLESHHDFSFTFDLIFAMTPGWLPKLILMDIETIMRFV